jgi:ankyrin repeat protein
MLVGILGSCALCLAHETDQYTIPSERDFADLGPWLTLRAHAAIARGVQQTNERIGRALRTKRPRSLQHCQEPDQLAYAVNAQFPYAVTGIEGLNRYVLNPLTPLTYGGDMAGFRPADPVGSVLATRYNPLAPWQSATIKAYGTFVGADKIGHATDMGMHYYKRYRAHLKAGDSSEQAVQAAVAIGTHGPIYSERGLLGYWTAGAYSNADLVANYIGMQFYRNLTDPVMLNGVLRPPMVVRDGDYWRIADFVQPDSDFLSFFFSEHMDEAMNPSRYLPMHRPTVTREILDRRETVMDARRDRHGNWRLPAHFAEKAERYRTYYGENYGHEGSREEILSLDRVAYASFPQDAPSAARGFDGSTPMHVAAERGDLEWVRRLLDAGADPHAVMSREKGSAGNGGLTPLHLAAREGREQVVALLIERGADVRRASDRGVTPLHMAIWSPAVAAQLLTAGAQPAAADVRGRTPLHWAAYDPESPHAVLDLLLSHKADVAAADHFGKTPLHLASQANRPYAVQRLLDAQADVNAPDEFGLTPLHVAASASADAIATLLLQNGAALEAADAFGCTPLHAAVRSGSGSTVLLLLQAGADGNARDAYGATPLHMAASVGRPEIARLLLAHGSSRDKPNASGQTPADLARAAGHVGLAGMIESYNGQRASVDQGIP